MIYTISFNFINVHAFCLQDSSTLTDPISKQYGSSSLHPAYLRGKHAVIQEGISLATAMLKMQ